MNHSKSLTKSLLSAKEPLRLSTGNDTSNKENNFSKLKQENETLRHKLKIKSKAV